MQPRPEMPVEIRSHPGSLARMDFVHRHARPQLRRPNAIVAFEGWNDACDAASGVVRYLIDQFGVTTPFASIEPEEFFDFQETRPTVEIADGGTRRLTWPDTRFYGIRLPDSERDLILVLGEEPSLRWKTFARSVTGVLSEHDVEHAIFLGAYIGQVSHLRPVHLAGTATDPLDVTRNGLDASTYEGPTGIIGVLGEACREVGMTALSIWAATPHYLAANPNPQTMLALMRKAAEVAGITVDTTDLVRLETDFVEQVEAAVQESDDLSDYIATLTEDHTLDPGMSNELVGEIERYLKNQG